MRIKRPKKLSILFTNAEIILKDETREEEVEKETKGKKFKRKICFAFKLFYILISRNVSI